MSFIEFKAEDLPSRGTTYPEGTIFHVNMFNYGEIQDLNSSSLAIETKINNFIKATSINTDMSGEKIAYIDYIYMHLGRVASTYGASAIKLPIICPFCDGSIDETIEFESIETNDISAYADIIPLTFDISGQQFSFNFLTLEKIIKWFRLINNINQYEVYKEISSEIEAMRKEVDNISPENPNPVLLNKWEKLNKQYNDLHGRMTKKNIARATKYKPYGYNALLLAFMCSDFGSEDFDNFLNKLNSKDINREALEYLNFVETTLGTGLKTMKASCPHCSKIFAYSLEDNVNDVYPFRHSSANIADKLRAMQASAPATVPTEE